MNLLKECNLCPRKCGVNRYQKLGYCGAGAQLKVAYYSLHMWEEPVISGDKGSGTIFFSHCNLKCMYCQNSNDNYCKYCKKNNETTPTSKTQIRSLSIDKKYIQKSIYDKSNNPNNNNNSNKSPTFLYQSYVKPIIGDNQKKKIKNINRKDLKKCNLDLKKLFYYKFNFKFF